MTTVSVLLEQQADYRFEINFGNNLPGLIADEHAPLGKGEGPSAAQLLCAAVGNCLSDRSCLHCVSSSRRQSPCAAK